MIQGFLFTIEFCIAWRSFYYEGWNMWTDTVKKSEVFLFLFQHRGLKIGAYCRRNSFELCTVLENVFLSSSVLWIEDMKRIILFYSQYTKLSILSVYFNNTEMISSNSAAIKTYLGVFFTSPFLMKTSVLM